MRKKFMTIGLALVLFFAVAVWHSSVFAQAPAPTPAPTSTTCEPKGSVLGFPTWYKYLEGQKNAKALLGAGPNTLCRPILNSLNDVWLVVAAVIEILLRIATLVALGFVVTGGVRYITAVGEPDKLKQAKGTIINAAIGLVIAISSAALVSFIARKF